MRLQAVILGLALLSLACVSRAEVYTFTDRPFLWPAPASMTYGNTTLSLQRNKFSITLDSGISSSQLLNSAADRYYALIFNHAAVSVQVTLLSTNTVAAPSDSLVQLKIVVSSTNETLQLGTDESYNLTVPVTAPTPNTGLVATLTANTVYGAMRGLETFSQLIRFDGSVFSIPFAPYAIQDAPRYPWRGLLVDTSRHYHPLWSLKHIIDGMSLSKLNVLHWHVTDAESFPLQLKSRPDLANKGSWVSGNSYSAADVTEILDYAKARGIRVVAEIDNPGHTYSWGKAFPDIVAYCANYVASNPTYPEIDSVPLDMTNPNTAKVVADVLKEAATLFPDSYFHLGGDEVIYACLDELPRIKEWMRANLNSTDYDDLVAYHLNQSVPNILNQNKKAIFWQEVFSNVVFTRKNGESLPIRPGNSVMQVWFGGQGMNDTIVKALSMGYEVLWSWGWYLDQQNPAINRHQTFYLFQDTWEAFYSVEPTANLNATPEQLKLILGGEASQWGETAHPYAFDENVWPRAAATAEKLWSPIELTQSVNEAYHRYIRHQCRLVQRGIRASSFRPNFCPSPLLDTEIPSTQPRNTVVLPIWAVVIMGLVIVLFGTMTIGFYLRTRRSSNYQQLA